MSQIDTENDKKPKTFQFSKILCIWFQVSTDIVDRNVQKSQQGKNVLSKSLFRRVYFIFFIENVSN